MQKIIISIAFFVSICCLAWTNSGRIYYGFSGEKITDGDGSSDSFDLGTGGWSYDAGNQEWDCDGSQVGNSWLTQVAATFNVGEWLIIQYTIRNYSAGTVRARFSANPRLANGTYTEIVRADSVLPWGLIADASFTGTVDDLSVKRVP